MEGTDTEALYGYARAYLPHSFATHDTLERARIVARLIPRTSRGSAFAKTKGWDAFKDLLVCVGPDLLVLSPKKHRMRTMDGYACFASTTGLL